ncbi:MAG: PIN domain-containing protein [Gammaproteobacteria bacterium]|nr:PIN domain-containing protein [Gammaproteobacteria bacterium]
MILIDTGPLVALFNPRDHDHKACRAILETISEPMLTTEAVLTEVMHLLIPGSRGIEGLMSFVMSDYLSPVALARSDHQQSFTLMNKYNDLPMDFADATLVAIAEKLKISQVFTLDISDFNAYRIKKGHRYYPLELVGRSKLE